LVVELRAAVSKALKHNTRVRQEGALVKQNGNYLNVTVEVVPFQVPPSRERYYLILLEGTVRHDTPAEGRKKKGAKESVRTRQGAQMNRLRDELAGTRESLQAIIEEHEATNEELRSANEETMSSNEELQSTNEELETAKEELQSTNEELTTLNEELENRNNAMDNINNDLQNLLARVNIPVLILGRDLRIRRLTAVAEKVFNLIPADIGRPVRHLQSGVARAPGGEVGDLLTARSQRGTGGVVVRSIRPIKPPITALTERSSLCGCGCHEINDDQQRKRAALVEGIVNTAAPLVVLTIA
jgi:two-component system CheB/CheR fusion protein